MASRRTHRTHRKVEHAVAAIVISCVALAMMGIMFAGAIYGDCHRADHKFTNRIDCVLMR